MSETATFTLPGDERRMASTTAFAADAASSFFLLMRASRSWRKAPF